MAVGTKVTEGLPIGDPSAKKADGLKLRLG